MKRCARWAALLLTIGAPLGAEPYFSLAPAGPSGLDASGVAAAGPGGTAATELVAASALGLSGAGSDDLNAMTSIGVGGYGLLHFSVSSGSAGVAFFSPDVASEATAGHAAADILLSRSPITVVGSVNPHSYSPSTVAWNQDLLGLLPAVAVGIPSTDPVDDIDALDLAYAAAAPAAFALATGHSYLGASGSTGCGGDLFSPGVGSPTPLTAFGAIGLGSCSDDVDALHIETAAGTVWFSLAPGSPSLSAGSIIPNCTASGCSAADIFAFESGATNAVVGYPAAALKLQTSDDVDALSLQPAACPSALGDTDGDGIDDSCDACVSNRFSDADSDADGFGTGCDPDYTQDNVTGVPDFSIYLPSFGSTVGTPTGNLHTDNTVDSVTGINDYSILLINFTLPPGPSGLSCAGTPPCTH